MNEYIEDMRLNDACRVQHEAVVKKGFEPQPVATNLMLIVSELSEALEADRHDRHADYDAFENALPKAYIGMNGGVLFELKNNEQTPINKDYARSLYKAAFEKHVKDSFEDEIADAFLRLMDLCGEHGIDIEKHIRAKFVYNTMRPTKHGKAY